MQDDLEKDLQIQQLINQTSPPSIEDIASLARERGITCVAAFWNFFDKIHKLRREKRKAYD